MASLFTHPIPTLAFAVGVGGISWRLLLAGVICSVLPDLDVLGFRFGIVYADALGHRGISHSLVFAFGVGLLGALCAPFLRSSRWVAFLVTGASVAGHILLDAMTTGGLGVAAFWPWDKTRYFLAWRPIVVSPFSIKKFFSDQGVRVLVSEGLWVWLPCAIGVVVARVVRWGR